jgi:hypothetical protein
MMTQAHYQPSDTPPVRGYDITCQSSPLTPGAKQLIIRHFQINRLQPRGLTNPPHLSRPIPINGRRVQKSPWALTIPITKRQTLTPVSPSGAGGLLAFIKFIHANI